MRSILHSAEVNTTNDVPSLVTNPLIRNGSSFASNQVIGSEAQKKELLPRMHECMRSVVHSDEVNTMKDVIRVFVANLLIIKERAFAKNARMNKTNCAFI